MITKEEMAGKWKEISGKVKNEWGEVTDDELQQCEGNVDQLVGLIQRKTGETRAKVEDRLHDLVSHSEDYFANARHMAEQYGSQAAEAARAQFGQAEEMVRRRPAESVVVAFGTGLLVGVVVGLMTRSR